MQMKHHKKILSFMLCMTLSAAMAFSTTGCHGSNKPSNAGAETTVQAESDVQTDYIQLGEGSTKFIFTVVDKDGVETQYEIHTDQDTVGKALLELELIDGEESEYGLYVKTVNGITADYDKDGVYWAFYINDEYAQTGVDAAKITEGNSYSFRVE